MTKRFGHLIYIPFTGVGLNGGYGGDDWFKRRIEVFKEFTLPSLLRQTSKQFIVWVSFRPQERENPLTIDLEAYLKTKGINFVMTFDGLMYFDDKFSQKPKDMAMNFARLLRQCWRNGNCKGLLNSSIEIFKGKNKTLKSRLSRSLAKIQRIFFGVDMMYVTRIDSDDMFHKEAIEEIQAETREPGTALVYTKGYVYNAETREYAEWNPKTNPPFHTIIFNERDFFDPWLYLKTMKGYRSHEDVPKAFKVKVLSDGKYCVVVHGKGNHISTVWNHPFKGEIVDKPVGFE